jgi:hypothetical protein
MPVPREIELSPRFILNTETEMIHERGTKPLRLFRAADNTRAIEIFRDRMESWFFDPAQRLVKAGEHIAAAHIVTPMIEALENRYQGESSKGRSEEFFTRRAKQIFSIDDATIGILYRGVRCGFAHYGFLKDDDKKCNVLITSGLSAPIIPEERLLWIDAPKYVDAIHQAFLKYYDLVSGGDAELKRRFEKLWDDEWPASLRGMDVFGSAKKS